jgi:uncharacterized membrane protein
MARRRFSHSLGHRADQAGILLAGANVPLTFQRTLMPRPTVDQALVTGLSMASNHALVSLIQESIQAAALIAIRPGPGGEENDAAWSKATFAADVAAFGAGLAIQRAFSGRSREPLPRAGVRTAGFWLSVTGAAAGIVGAVQEVGTRRGRRRRTIPAVIPAAGVMAAAVEYRMRRAERLDAGLPPDGAEVNLPKALGLAAGVAGATSALGLGERVFADAVARGASKVLPVREQILRPLGHAVALAAIGGGIRVLVHKVLSGIEHKEESVEAAFDVSPPNPLVSGSFDSHVSFDTLSKQGRRFAWMVNSAKGIADTMGESDARSPIRVYAGLESADTEETRVALILDELDRTRAFDRKWILVASPTGTGYVNYAAVSALEFLSRGDCAAIAMQYSARPSVLSLDNVNEGRSQARLLLDALHARLADLPEASRPKLVLFGESLGAWTSQDPFVDRGTDGLIETGVDHAIWIGTPHFSKWKEQVLFDERSDVDHSLIGVFDNIDEYHACSVEEKASIKYVMITHYNDGVAVFGPELAIQAPLWLAKPDTRPPRIPKAMRWMPSTTFFQVLVDMKNSANVVAGQFAATGHDYRADLLPFFHATLGFDASDEQLERIHARLEQRELERSEWIKRHGTAGRSLATAVIEAAMREIKADGGDPNLRLAHLVRAVAEEEFGASGGASTPVGDADTDA